MGSIKSTNSTSPGVGFGIWSVVVDDFDTVRTSLRPHEADTPLPIDPDAVLAGSIALQRLEVIVRRHGKVVQYPGVVQNSQLPQGTPLDVLGQGPTELAIPYRSQTIES